MQLVRQRDQWEVDLYYAQSRLFFQLGQGWLTRLTSLENPALKLALHETNAHN